MTFFFQIQLVFWNQYVQLLHKDLDYGVVQKYYYHPKTKFQEGNVDGVPHTWTPTVQGTPPNHHLSNPHQKSRKCTHKT